VNIRKSLKCPIELPKVQVRDPAYRTGQQHTRERVGAEMIFMDATENLNGVGTKIQNQQNNFIEINGITVTEQQLQNCLLKNNYRLKKFLN